MGTKAGPFYFCNVQKPRVVADSYTRSTRWPPAKNCQSDMFTSLLNRRTIGRHYEVRNRRASWSHAHCLRMSCQFQAASRQAAACGACVAKQYKYFVSSLVLAHSLLPDKADARVSTAVPVSSSVND